ncbi:MAG: hypothetical protein ACLU9Q_12345 [Marvinbryantia sp.]|uniref:hypothetical protein n=1 Tax=Marvinbryantia sp. TaxID=2496532 RepID=UPI0025F86A4C|nr:hypothetical protein [uncultured Marvinbryantia sp.]
MLKIRMQGTVQDIQWFKGFLERHKEIKVKSVSEPFTNKGTKRYFRVYAEIENEAEKEKQQREGAADAENPV